MNIVERWAAEELVRTPSGPSADELRRRARVRRTRRFGATLSAVAVVTVVAAIAVSRPTPDRRVEVVEPAPTTPTTSTSTTTTTTTTRPDAVSLLTPWRPLDASEGMWKAALVAIRSSETADAAVARVLPILRAGRELPSETITARVIDRRGDHAVIRIEWRGYGDDSVGGTDVRISVATGMPTVVVRSAETRSVCRRGAGDDFCV